MIGSVLNTFMLVFETDGDEVAVKKIEKLDKAGQKLVKTTDNTSKSAKTAAAEFKHLSRSLAAAIAPAVALGTVLSKTLNFAMQGEQLLFMAKSANMAASEFQKLAIASQRFGGSREGAAGMMAGLASQIQALRLGQSAPLQEAAMFYGLNLQGKGGGLATGNELLRNIAATMGRLDNAAQLDLGRRIGLDEATIRLLQRGVAAFDEELARAEKRSIFRPDDLKRAQEMEMAVRDLKLSLEGLWAEIARWLLPAVQTLTEYATQGIDYLTDHADFVKGALAIIAALMAAIAVSSLGAVAPWIAMAALIGAVAAGIALVYEDFMVFARGGESALEPLWNILVSIGRWFQEDFPAFIRNAVELLKNVFNPLSGIKKFFNIGQVSMQNADLNPLAAMASGPISNMYNYLNNNRTNNQYSLTVNGAQDPVAGGAYLLNQARNEDALALTSGQQG